MKNGDLLQLRELHQSVQQAPPQQGPRVRQKLHRQRSLTRRISGKHRKHVQLEPIHEGRRSQARQADRGAGGRLRRHANGDFHRNERLHNSRIPQIGR